MYVILKKISNLTFLFFLVLCLLLFAFYKTKLVYFITYTEVRSGRKAGISTFSFRTILNFGSVPEVAFSPFRAPSHLALHLCLLYQLCAFERHD